MNLQYIISLILINTIAIHGEWEGCSLSLGSDDNLVKSGEVSSVCLTVGPSTDWGANNSNFDYNRFTFQPKADEFSHMHIDGCKFRATVFVVIAPFLAVSFLFYKSILVPTLLNLSHVPAHISFHSYEYTNHVTLAYEAYSNENEDKHIFVASQTAVSFLRKYYDATLDHIFPHLTAIIDVEDGVSILTFSCQLFVILH